MNKKGFTIAEVLLATVIAVYIFFGAWSIFGVSKTWWEETLHWVDAQRIARVTLDSIIRGTIDPTAGTETIGANTYSLRNGIESATSAPTLAANSIRYALEGDTSNIRSFYLGTDPGTGRNALFYTSNVNTSVGQGIRPTIGITDVDFATVSGNTNLIRVTSRVTDTFQGTRPEGYTVSVSLSEDICLRNF